MKLISLNIWGGRIYEDLLAFVRQHRDDTDVFCFQEVFSCAQPLVSRGTRLDIFEKLKKLLPGHTALFAPIQVGIDATGRIRTSAVFGQGMFVKHSVRVGTHGFIFTHGGRNVMKGNVQETLGCGFHHVVLAFGKKKLLVAGVHGISRPGDKRDTPARIAQSRKIIAFISSHAGPKIVCGDFNLMPDTKSVRILEASMQNLIADYNIATTRSALNAKKYPRKELQRFADYTFVTPDVRVRSFTVPNIPISDHLPMILDFTL